MTGGPEARVGDIRVDVVGDGLFGLDGGAVFGVVPKPLWQRKLPADDQNRVTLGLNCLLLTCDDGTRVLVDTGMGGRWSEREAERLALRRDENAPGVLAGLASLGVAPEDVDVVVSTHLHFDHAGGNVRVDDSGALVPAFPRARHVVQAVEWRDAGCPHDRNRASYREDDFAPLEAHGLLERVEERAEIAPGVSVERCPGHCPGMQVVRAESRGHVLLCPADLMPTSAHVRPAWTMAFDLDVTATVKAKHALVDEAIERDALVCLYHDARAPLVNLRRHVHEGRETLAAVPLQPGEAA